MVQGLFCLATGWYSCYFSGYFKVAEPRYPMVQLLRLSHGHDLRDETVIRTQPEELPFIHDAGGLPFGIGVGVGVGVGSGPGLGL